MIFRVRRQQDGQFALEQKALDAVGQNYWRGVGTYVTQEAAVAAAPAIKTAQEAADLYAADVAAGRDIVQTITL